MTDSLESVYKVFFDLVEQDRDFFQYYEVDETEAMELAKERARTFLFEACSYIRRDLPMEFDLRIVTDEESQKEKFATQITEDEVHILAQAMMLPYYERGLVSLLPKLNTFSASELKLLHSPANERKTYLGLISDQRERLEHLLSVYFSKDRLTGKYKYISTTLPQEEI